MTIVDMSKHQPSALINWAEFSQHVELLILRVQYGSTVPDTEYKNHVTNAKAHGVPFHTYAFPEFISVNDARVEARDAAARQDSESKGMVIDIESEYDSNRKPVGITKLDYNTRLEGIKAYVDELRKQGVKMVGAYIAHNVFASWGINNILGLFDYIWIPRYGTNNGQPQTKPDFPCDIWQYTSVGRIPGYDGNLDLNVLTGSKPLEFFTGTPVSAPTPQPVTPEPVTQPPAKTVTLAPWATQYATGENIADFVRGKQYQVIQEKPYVKSLSKKAYLLSGIMSWVLEQDIVEFVSGPPTSAPVIPQTYTVQSGDSLSKIAGEFGTTVDNLVRLNNIANPSLIFPGKVLRVSGSAPAPTPKPEYYIIKSGDALSKIAARFGTTVKQLQAWNGIKNPNIISAGKKIRVK